MGKNLDGMSYECKLKNRRVIVVRVNADKYGLEFRRLQADLALEPYNCESNRNVTIRRGTVTTRVSMSRDAFLAMMTAGVAMLQAEETMNLLKEQEAPRG